MLADSGPQPVEFIGFIMKVIVLGMGILVIILGLVPNILDAEGQSMTINSPEGLTMPEEGYVTPVYDPLTSITVRVEADRNVEVHLFSSNYRGGKLMKDPANNSVIRDEWLAAGELSERTGTVVVLKDFTAYSSQYIVMVDNPRTTAPSDADYTITITANTTNMTLIIAGLIFLVIFYLISILGNQARISRTGVPMKTTEEEDTSGRDEWERSQGNFMTPMRDGFPLDRATEEPPLR